MRALLLLILLISGSAGLAGSNPAKLTSHALVGKWATVHDGDKRHACATDYISKLRPNGRYFGYLAEGVWKLDGHTVTIRILRSNYATGGEGPMLRLSKPDVLRFDVVLVGSEMKFGSDTVIRC